MGLRIVAPLFPIPMGKVRWTFKCFSPAQDVTVKLKKKKKRQEILKLIFLHDIF